MVSDNIKNNKCIGCGVCAGTCTAVEMHFSGERYYPIVNQSKCSKCGKCLKICGFTSGKSSETSKLLYNDKIGYYISCGIGVSDELKKVSASGGLLSQFLITLMNEHKIDSVISVVSTNDASLKFKYRLSDSVKEIKESAGSAYFPVELSTLLREIKRSERKCAIVALPCIVSSLRNAIRYDKKLNESIRFLIGIACGGLPEASLLQYVSNDLGVDYERISNVCFRKKKKNQACNNYCLSIKDEDETEYQTSFQDKEKDKVSEFGKVFLNKAFFHDCCLICQDATAENADISFMDAWLPDLSKKEYGTSMFIVRSNHALEIIDIMKKMNYIEDIKVEKVIAAQESVNLIQSKKIESEFRKFFLYGKSNKSIIHDVSIRRRIWLYIKAMRQIYITKKSKKIWNEFKIKKYSFYKLKIKINNIMGTKI